MEKNKKYTLLFRVNEEEYKIINYNYKLSKKKSMSEYLRMMSMFGYINFLSDEENKNLKNIKKDFAGVGRNINQIAIKCNKNNFHTEDIKDLQNQIKNLTKIMEKLFNLYNNSDLNLDNKSKEHY